MFTGLIEDTGRVRAVDATSTGRRVRVETGLAQALRLGDSIAVGGVCLTVVERTDAEFSADVSPETLRVTSLGLLAAGRRVNLERPLRADSRLGGHFVLGHVDAVGRVDVWRPDGECHWLEVAVPLALEPLLVPKGSIAVDGVSLTVASLSEGRFGVQIIPFTLAHTSFSHLAVGDSVNLEADVIGKYVARLLGQRDVGLVDTQSISLMGTRS
jgi:riboflavin synthase